MSSTPTSNGPLPLSGLPADLLSTTAAALDAVARLAEAAERGVAALVAPDGRVDAAALDRHQVAAHGFAWVATYAEALRQMQGWAERLDRAGRLGELEACMLQAAFGEYLAQLDGGLAMSQGEIVRPADFGLDDAERAAFRTDAVRRLIAAGNASALRLRIAERLADALHGGGFGEAALEDEALDMVREQFRRFVADVVEPHAHEWHLKDELIPMPVVEQMAEMGVFGLTVPEEDGGLGMGKLAMCVVTEELSRGYIGVGSLGTRAEIAAELIRLGGTAEQRARWLPRLASGEILPTAVFTEPNTGSDLGSLRTRAVLDGDTYRVTGAKTWITHASRSDLMTLLVRTDPDAPGYRGLSMLLAEKPRGTEADPFPAEGMSGGEIPVLGYRGMKEYEIGFDGFAVPRENLLGEVEGQGFKQLMATFESARVQTAARAVGVAQNAMELGLRYAQERVQFGRPLAAFPRVAGKLAWMAVETMIARQLTYFAAREKDSDRRCDIEAGMAKLLAARVAWSNADNAVQIHGGNGYAVEYPISRVLCDARILNIFEGAAEIQAQVVARGLLTRRN
ncbi:acyl-CoA dehydrogenase (plasmid) [Azospirillum sp. TSH58]|uniref:acyl-CoA dehydrogenase family protein n=1 Tax=Azospirillum sp. TSH58 TaxID=664962 RepID=UPI000D601D92|nr:acyl-CoA dehydrogenase family protein [Azospirillum sp. TSH58]AWJ85719.1 acyl-CoA dehydrogenase [Azospirillum sp. TSH58]PWC67821.1 acyl-CoA dehydrogenase [Azospirillum sp. TSH58]